MAPKPIRIPVEIDPSGVKTGMDEVDDQLGRVKKSSTFFSSAVEGISTKLRSFGSVGESAAGQLEGFAGKLDKLGPGLVAFGGIAAAAGGALVKFGADALKQVGELAQGVLTLQRLTGQTAESASALILAADDYGISAEDLASSLGKIAKQAGDGKEPLEEFGVTMGRTADGALDTTETLYRIADAFAATEDPAIRAELGTAAFGKSWQSMAPVLAQGRKGIEDMTAGIDQHRLLTEKDVEQQERLRLAMDDLSETFDGLKTSVAVGITPALTDLANIVQPVSSFFGQWGDELSYVWNRTNIVTGQIYLLKDAIDDIRNMGNPFSGIASGIRSFVSSGPSLPFRASGGPVSAGQPYVVGERGPEVMVPGQSGTVIPNGAGVGGGTVVNIYAQSPDAIAEALRRYNKLNGTGWFQ